VDSASTTNTGGRRTDNNAQLFGVWTVRGLELSCTAGMKHFRYLRTRRGMGWGCIAVESKREGRFLLLVLQPAWRASRLINETTARQRKTSNVAYGLLTVLNIKTNASMLNCRHFLNKRHRAALSTI